MSGIKINGTDNRPGTIKVPGGAVTESNQDYGPTSSTGYWSIVKPPYLGWVIYTPKASGGPSTYIAKDSKELIFHINSFCNTSFAISDLTAALSWAATHNMIIVAGEPAQIESNNLIFHIDAGWTFNNITGGALFNIRNAGYAEATLTNCSFSPSGDGSLALTNGSFINLPCQNTGTQVYTGSGGWTAELWINPAVGDVRTAPQIVYETESITVSLQKIAGNNYGLMIGKSSEALSSGTLFSLNPIVAGKWNHIAIVINNYRNPAIWINGNYIENATDIVLTNGESPNDHSISFGNNTNFYNGLISIFRLYDTNLNSTKLLANWNAERQRFGRYDSDNFILVHAPLTDSPSIGDYSNNGGQNYETSLGRHAVSSQKTYTRNWNTDIRDDSASGSELLSLQRDGGGSIVVEQAEGSSDYTISQWVRIDDFPKKYINRNRSKKPKRKKTMVFTAFNFGAMTLEFGAMAPYWRDNTGASTYQYKYSPFSFCLAMNTGPGFGTQFVYTDYKFKLGQWYLVTVNFKYLNDDPAISMYVNDQLEPIAWSLGRPWARRRKQANSDYYNKNMPRTKRRGGWIAGGPGFLPADTGSPVASSTTRTLLSGRDSNFFAVRLVDLYSITYSPIGGRINNKGQEIQFGKTFIYQRPFDQSLYTNP